MYPHPTRPVYVAADYGKPGEPALTDAERSRIRLVLASVRPCQRSAVRYAFPEGAPEPMVVFFPLRELGSGVGIPFTHVIGEANTYYAPWTGDLHIGPIGADDPNSEPQKRLGIQWDVEREPCNHR